MDSQLKALETPDGSFKIILVDVPEQNCFVCKTTKMSKFWRHFPDDPTKRELWLKILSISLDVKVTTDHRLCDGKYDLVGYRWMCVLGIGVWLISL